jgi:hypothetical protein
MIKTFEILSVPKSFWMGVWLEKFCNVFMNDLLFFSYVLYILQLYFV